MPPWKVDDDNERGCTCNKSNNLERKSMKNHEVSIPYLYLINLFNLIKKHNFSQ
jgi:hypothetical protein